MLTTDWRPCPAPTRIEKGWFNSSADIQEYPPGTVVTYQCDTGYYIHSLVENFNFQTASTKEYSITCERNGEWNMEVPHCKGTWKELRGWNIWNNHRMIVRVR